MYCVLSNVIFDKVNPCNISVIYLINFKAKFLNQLWRKCLVLNNKMILSLEQTKIFNLHEIGSSKLQLYNL